MVAAALVAVSVWLGAAPAAAKREPCWKALINDWYDGRIDFEYPAKCYADAIKHAPEDLKGYSDLASDLTRALQGAARTRQGSHVVVAPGSRGRKLSGADKANDGGRSQEDRTGAVPPNSGGSDGPKGPIQRAIANVGDSGAASLPMPLLALGALALLLVAAGAASLVARRIQARRAAAAGPADGAP
jgi:hypothetical protein